MENLDWVRLTFQIRLPLNPSGDRVANGTPCFFLVLFETCILRIVSRVRVTFQSRLASNPSCGRTANAHLTSSSPPPPAAAPADDTSSLGFFWPPFYFQLLRCEHSQSPLYLMICSSDFWQPHIWTDIHIHQVSQAKKFAPSENGKLSAHLRAPQVSTTSSAKASENFWEFAQKAGKPAKRSVVITILLFSDSLKLTSESINC